MTIEQISISTSSEDCKNIPTYSKALDQGEAFLYKSLFPNLNVNTTRETSISTQCYNCVAWTLGITDDWLWPQYHAYATDKDTTLEDFDRFYQEAGFVKVSAINDAHIAAWGNSLPNDKLYMTHASVIYSQTKQWESKLGAYIRMSHDLDGLIGDAYGKPVVYYKKKDNYNLLQARLEKMASQPLITQTNLVKLTEKLQTLSASVISDFDNKYADWIETWADSASEAALLGSNPAARKLSEAYKNLIQFGKNTDILPLIVLRLYSGDYWALLPYDELQQIEKLKVFYGEECHVLEGESGRARRTVKKYIDSL